MNQLQDHIRHFGGAELLQDAASRHKNPSGSTRCSLNGTDGSGKPMSLGLDDALLSKHLLFLGNIGTGKTNAISQIVSQVKSQLKEDDLLIIFDTKGDFYQQFYTEGDVVVTNDSSRFKGAENHWNIFSEINIDNDPQRIVENCLEIANNLFADKIKKSQSPFFPLAAKDVFATFLKVAATRLRPEVRNNRELANFFLAASRKDIQLFFESNNENRIGSYISKDAAAQADGILAEMNQLLGEIFIGDFRHTGDLSMRDLVRKKGGKSIFLEYDISVGSVLTPIYRLLFDLAIKETLSGQASAGARGNVWFLIDEFSLLPNLKYLDNGVNFGRSQGAKFIIGVQNIPQVYHEYGEHLGQSLLSGIRSVFAFHVDDQKSREFVQNRYGFAQKKLSYADAFGKSVVNVTPMKVVEDWDISQLNTGNAIVGLPEGNPFVFRFEEYKG